VSSNSLLVGRGVVWEIGTMTLDEVSVFIIDNYDYHDSRRYCIAIDPDLWPDAVGQKIRLFDRLRNGF
jgi:hypothetical protein